LRGQREGAAITENGLRISKLAQIMFTLDLGAALEGTGVTVMFVFDANLA
jgi:hypothetical protein